MGSQGVQREIQITAGNGLVAHLDGFLAYANGESEQLNELRTKLDALADVSWHEAVRMITTTITSCGFEDHPHLTCVAIEENKVSAFVFGSIELNLVVDGETQVLDGRDSSTWIDVVIRGSIDQIRVGAAARAPIVGVLRDGIVPAGGFVFQNSLPNPPAQERNAEAPALAVVPEPSSPQDASTPGSPAPNDNATTAPGMFAFISQVSDDEAESSDHDDTERKPKMATPVVEAEASNEPQIPTEPTPFDLLEQREAKRRSVTVAAAKPRPKLRGVHCSSGHFTSTEDDRCRTCGIEVAPGTQTLAGPRPVLGHLNFDDGATLAIDRPAVIGANPPNGYSVDEEPTTSVRLDDGHGGISDVHLEVRPAGWRVEIIDTGSKNGTYTVMDGARQTRTRLRVGQPVRVQDGMTVEVGTRAFTFSVTPKQA